jgi:hypothetical protein
MKMANINMFTEIRERAIGIIERGREEVMNRGLREDYERAYRRLNIVEQAVNFIECSECFSKDEARKYGSRYHSLVDSLQDLEHSKDSDMSYKTISRMD